MFDAVKKHLENILALDEDAPSGDDTLTTSLAATALLLEAAQADYHEDDEELKQIKTTLINHFGINPADIEQTLETARQELKQATCLYELTKLINRNWNEPQKIQLLEAMWSVVLSDAHIDDHEHHLMRKIKGLLHIPHSQYISAKFRAAKSLES